MKEETKKEHPVFTEMDKYWGHKMSIDPFELHPSDKKLSVDRLDNSEDPVFKILDTEINNFKRNDNMLIAAVLEKVKNKIKIALRE